MLADASMTDLALQHETFRSTSCQGSPGDAHAHAQRTSVFTFACCHSWFCRQRGCVYGTAGAVASTTAAASPLRLKQMSLGLRDTVVMLRRYAVPAAAGTLFWRPRALAIPLGQHQAPAQKWSLWQRITGGAQDASPFTSSSVSPSGVRAHVP